MNPHNCQIFSISSKTHHPCPPIVAEANAILWAAQLAIQEGWSHIIIEGDAKRCFDPLSIEDVIPDWSIANLVYGILNLKVGFVQCCFCWVNFVAHVIARLSLATSKSFCFNKYNLPRVVQCPLCLFGRLSLRAFHLNKI